MTTSDTFLSPTDAKYFKKLGKTALGFQGMGKDYLPNVVRGLLLGATDILLDQLFNDFATLNHGYDNITVGTSEDSFEAIDQLPEQFHSQIGALFAKQFIVTVAELSAQMTGVWQGPANVAQELALSFLLDIAEGSAELFDIELDDEWLPAAREVLYEDFDYEFLYATPEVSTTEFAAFSELMGLGFASLSFDDLFTPFNGRTVSPYLR